MKSGPRRILFVAMHRPGRSPGQRFRFEQYLDFLRANGFACDLSYLISEADDAVVYAPGRYARKLGVFVKSLMVRLGDILAAPRYDIVFIFREALMANTAIVEIALAARGPKIVFDFDDAIWLQPVSAANSSLGFLRAGPSKVPAILTRADLVTVGNRYLADYAAQWNGNVHVVPTTLDTTTHAPGPPKPVSDVVCIGWNGSPSTVPYFDAITRPLVQLKQRYGDKVRFEVVGDGAYRNPALGVVGRPWRLETEVEDVRRLDIGLMPMPDDDWTRGKCGFKALLYMAMAIPPVVSPVGVNREIVQEDVNGCLASSPDEWLENLSMLVEQPALRAELGRRGRQTVVERYSFDSQKDRYLALFDSLLG